MATLKTHALVDWWTALWLGLRRGLLPIVSAATREEPDNRPALEDLLAMTGECCLPSGSAFPLPYAPQESQVLPGMVDPLRVHAEERALELIARISES